MDFGRLDPIEVSFVNHTLPSDGKFTDLTLPGTPAPKCNFYLGFPRWGQKEWLGEIYPLKTKESNFLDEYAKNFNSLELNAVFYSLPWAELIEKWKDKLDANAKPGFLMFPKMVRNVTHINRLTDVKEIADKHIEMMRIFGPYLGPIFIQMGDNFGPKGMNLVKQFVSDLPQDLKFMFEIRHPEWFDNSGELFQSLRSYNLGSVIADTSGRRDAVHMELTTRDAYIRFVGNGPECKNIDFARVDDWVNRLQNWVSRGLENVYFIVHQQDAINITGAETDRRYSLQLAEYAIKQFNEKLSAGIPPLKF
jgi:uncharacterized protein YecE (DUF72 family)